MTLSPTDVHREVYFPTLIYRFHLPEAERLNHNLLAEIRADHTRDRAGLKRSNFTELGGWHSQNALHKIPAYVGLTREIEAACTMISGELRYSDRHHLKIGTMWSIINPPGSCNRAHIHPQSLWSGVYYVQAAHGAGDLEFIDPRTAYVMNQPHHRSDEKRPQACWSKVTHEPKPGKMLIFPSWLYHAVAPNTSGEDRVVVSFNLSQAGITARADTTVPQSEAMQVSA
jgi:uncharacterized protein (TIGR02466 family)